MQKKTLANPVIEASSDSSVLYKKYLPKFGVTIVGVSQSSGGKSSLLNALIFNGDVVGERIMKMVDDAIYVVEQYHYDDSDDIDDLSKRAMDDSIKFIESSAGKKMLNSQSVKSEDVDDDIESAIRELYGK